MEPNKPSYLWDKTGEPDPELVHWEQRLSPFSAHPQGQRAPTWPERTRARRVPRPWLYGTAAACCLLFAFVLLRIVWQPGRDWKVTTLSGVPRINHERIAAKGQLSAGELLQTDSHSRAMLRMGWIAKIEVGPSSQVRLLTTRSGHHRIWLQTGQITARVWAPPFTLFVDTPAATAIDLGCAFTLRLEEHGSGELHVTSGWVESERNDRQAIMPAGAMVLIRPVYGPGTPFFEDAPNRFRTALTELDFSPSGYQNRATLVILLAEARPRDAISLLSLLRRVPPSERGLVFDKASTFIPPPPDLTRDDVILGTNQHGLDEWWRKLGLGEAKSWFLQWRDIVTS